jgi:hypothetical protein
MLEALVADGRIALAAAFILLVELALSRRIAGAGAIDFALNTVAGLGLVGALYAALAGAGAPAVVLGLTLSFVAHLAVLARARRR